MSDRAARRRAIIEEILAAHLRKRGEAYLQDEDNDDDETPPWLRQAEEARTLPPSVLPALAALRRGFDDVDAGGTFVVPMEDESGPWWFLRTRTDGDDGFAIAFDGSGACDGAARTYLELCQWDSLDATLRLISAPVPEALLKRPSLWIEVMKKKQQQRRG